MKQLKSKKLAKPLLSDKIAEALTVQPRADIEDDHVFSTKPKTVSRADLGSSDSEEEAVISDFRKRNDNLLSQLSNKYKGEVVSRKQLEGESDSDTSGNESENYVQNNKSLSTRESDDGDSSTDEVQNKLKAALLAASDSDSLDSEDGESDNYSIGQNNHEENESEEEDGEGYDISQIDNPPKEEFEHMKKQNVSEEAKKGACVRNQLLVWESFLEMRIHLQRCMSTANQMPMPDVYQDLTQNKDFVEKCNVSKSNLTNVLDKFLLLQNMLFKKFPETKNLATKLQDNKNSEVQKPSTESDEEIPSDTDNEEIPSDTEPEDNADEPTAPTNKTKEKPSPQTKKRKLADYEKDISKSHKAFKSFRDSTIQKWNEKTRIATATNIKNSPTNTILQQITYILSDKDKLRRRTQLKRSEYDIIGYKNKPSTSNNKSENESELHLVSKDRKDDDEYIPEIFDDSDFYHQLLRELIECKSADVTDPVQLSRQWIALQQMRSKMKRKVDTKATKGRKIKYVVHNKLVNFMAPEKCNSWPDENANELFNSLFGKLFEQNNVGVDLNLENGFKLKN